MKNIIVVAALLSVLGTSVWAAESKAEVTVNGMVCSFCAQGITKKFTARPEVANVTVKLSDQKVYLTIKEGQTLPDEVIQGILKEAGYSVDKVERKGS